MRAAGGFASLSYPDAGHVLPALVGIIAGHALPRLRTGRSLIDEGIAGRTLYPLRAACRGLSGRSGSRSGRGRKAIEPERASGRLPRCQRGGVGNIGGFCLGFASAAKGILYSPVSCISLGHFTFADSQCLGILKDHGGETIKATVIAAVIVVR